MNGLIFTTTSTDPCGVDCHAQHGGTVMVVVNNSAHGAET